jgi:hypothetical protein
MASGEMLVDISTFKGIDQSQGAMNKDIRTSMDMVNFVIEDGAMKSAPGATRWGEELPTAGGESAVCGIAVCGMAVCGQDSTTDGAVRTTIMEAAYHRDDGTTEYRLIAGCGGSLYQLRDGKWELVGSGFSSDEWDDINYRKNTEEWHIITNGVDPVMYGTRDGTEYKAVEGVPVAGKYITLSDERLWLGGVAGDQETVYWSWDNDPNNWGVDAENPEQGGGFIKISTYDGTRVKAVKALMNDVVIFKDRSLHRITGSYPGEYVMVDVYGSTGPISENTIVSSGNNVYFLCGDGLCVYNGMTVQTLALAGGDNRLKLLADRINRQAAERAWSVIHKETMYVALPIDGSEENNAVLVYDMSDKIYTLITDYRVDSWLVYHADGQERLLFARGNQIMEMAGVTDDGRVIDARWISPWFDLGTKSAKKSSGRVYMSVEAESLTDELPRIRLTMQSEKKERSKEIEIKREGLTVIKPRVKIRGRMLRFKIETVGGTRLTIHQGIQIKVESDDD